jgi:hypothetical protein
LDLETAQYITSYYANFFTEKESKAWRHWSTEYKLVNGTFQTEEQKESRRKFNYKTGWMTEDPEILELLADGIDNFKIKTAERILNSNREEILLNKCPKCCKLTRTPQAKQCRHCGNDWH